MSVDPTLAFVGPVETLAELRSASERLERMHEWLDFMTWLVACGDVEYKSFAARTLSPQCRWSDTGHAGRACCAIPSLLAVRGGDSDVDERPAPPPWLAELQRHEAAWWNVVSGARAAHAVEVGDLAVALKRGSTDVEGAQASVRARSDTGDESSSSAYSSETRSTTSSDASSDDDDDDGDSESRRGDGDRNRGRRR